MDSEPKVHVDAILDIALTGEVTENQARNLGNLTLEERCDVIDCATESIMPLAEQPEPVMNRLKQVARAIRKPAVSPTFVQRFGTKQLQAPAENTPKIIVGGGTLATQSRSGKRNHPKITRR